MEKKKYFTEINIMRGIVVLFVVIGHSFDATETPSVLGFLKSLAYSFHMPAFFFISGFLFNNKLMSIDEKLNASKKKATRLMIPYLFLTFVTIVLKVSFGGFARNPLHYDTLLVDILIGRNPNGGLWFLYALFAVSILVILVSGIDEILFFIIAFGMYFSNMYFFQLSGHIGAFVMDYTVYYVFGMLIRRYYPNIKEYLMKILDTCCFIPVFLWGLFASVVFLHIYYYKIPFGFIIPYFGIISTLFLAIQIDGYQSGSKGFKILGEWGMDIYMIGYYVQQSIYVLLSKVLHMDYLIYSWCMFVLGIVLPIVISKWFVRKNKSLALLVLGRK